VRNLGYSTIYISTVTIFGPAARDKLSLTSICFLIQK
jgi:hypothetical protein